MSIDSEELLLRLEAAKRVALKAGEFLLQQEKAGVNVGHEKKRNDYVTESDSLCEHLIIDALRTQFPQDGFFGEEDGILSSGSGSRWVIDPIDGTVNFMRGIPNYTISIAWEVEPYQPLIGVVYVPRQNELFWGAEGNGAWLNDRRIKVSDISEPSKALIVCVPPHRVAEEMPAYYRIMEQFSRTASDLRSFGSAALELAYIAAGRMDGYYEKFLGWYDIAAGTAILRQAGGVVEPADTQVPLTDTRCDLIASNGHLQTWMGSMLHS